MTKAALAETAVRVTGGACVVLRDVLFIARTGRDGVGVPIAAYNGNNVAIENLQSTLLALVLTGAIINRVHMVIRTHYVPFPVEAGSCLTGERSDRTDRPQCAYHSRNECPSGRSHVAFSFGWIHFCSNKAARNAAGIRRKVVHQSPDGC